MQRCLTPDLPAVTPVLGAVTENRFVSRHCNGSEQDLLLDGRRRKSLRLEVLRQAISRPQVLKRSDARSRKSLSGFAHEDHFTLCQKPILFAVPFGLQVEIPRQI